jgi:sec-independent protein translocase protein TatA
MFGIGAQEMLLILLALVLLFGAKRIPQIARGLGQSVGEFRRGLKDTS